MDSNGLRKGVFLYEYISDESRLMDSKLSEKEHFYRELKERKKHTFTVVEGKVTLNNKSLSYDDTKL